MNKIQYKLFYLDKEKERKKIGHTCKLEILSYPSKTSFLGYIYNETETCPICIEQKEKEEKEQIEKEEYRINNTETINCHKCKVELPIRVFYGDLEGSYFYCLSCIPK